MAVTIREAYGTELTAIGKENRDIVVLDADVSSSTKSGMFAKEFPERFFNVGIAEANMNAMACGFASCGKIPFTNTFATFQTSNGLLSMRALASYNNLNVKFVGAYSGLSDSYDGPTHHSIDDLAIACALPNFTVVVASDEILTKFLTRNAAANTGPFYMRLSREALPKIYDEDRGFSIGKANVVSEGTDATVIACGVMVSEALRAANDLAGMGISIGVIDMFTIKPLDKEAIITAARKSGALVVAEEHNRIGGLGEKVAAVLAESDVHVPVEFVALNDTHTESGGYRELLSKYKLDAEAICVALKKAVGRK